MAINYTKLGYANILRNSGATLTLSSQGDTGATQSGFSLDAIKNPLTYSFWKGANSTEHFHIEVELTASETVDFLGIAAHQINSKDMEISLQYWDGSAYQDLIAFFTPSSDGPVMKTFTEQSSTKFRIILRPVGGGAASDWPRIGVVYIGKHLTMTVPALANGVVPPISSNLLTEINVSDTGQFLGISVIRAGQTFQHAWVRIPEQWFRDNFQPFINSFKTHPTFILWRPIKYPNDCVYAWRGSENPPVGQMMGIHDLMQVRLRAFGIGVDPEGNPL